MASVAILSVVIPITVIPAVAINDTKDNFESDIVLEKNQEIVKIAKLEQKIVPGESAVQTQERMAAEVAKVSLEAANAAKIASASKKIVADIDPSDFDGLYRSAGVAYGIDWRILKAIHYVETGASGSISKKNPSGATGPMQFIPSTWRYYGVDGNSDGSVDITNVSDSIYAAANYLAASGGARNGYKTALWSYNPSSRYFSKVIEVARSLGF